RSSRHRCGRLLLGLLQEGIVGAAVAPQRLTRQRSRRRGAITSRRRHQEDAGQNDDDCDGDDDCDHAPSFLPSYRSKISWTPWRHGKMKLNPSPRKNDPRMTSTAQNIMK